MSLSTGIIVTRAASEDDLGVNVLAQLLALPARCADSRHRHLRPRPAARVCRSSPSSSSVRSFSSSAAACPLDCADAAAGETASRPVPAPPAPDAPAQLAKETGVMPLELELGMEIIDLVDPKRHGDLLDRVKALRRTIAQELGIVIPPVHARDNERLQPTHYAFRVHGVQVAEGEAPPRLLLAVGKGLDRIEGEPTRDPAYGGPAKWIPNEMRYRATVAGATVVERSAVVTTHLSEVVRRHAGELLSRQDVRLLLDT